MLKKIIINSGIFMGLCLAIQASAHSPMCTCYDNGDNSITCEGAFSDGSSSAGVTMLIKDKGGKVISQGKMDKTGTFTFKKPSGDYKVVFDGGTGHLIEINGRSIKN